MLRIRKRERKHWSMYRGYGTVEEEGGKAKIILPAVALGLFGMFIAGIVGYVWGRHDEDKEWKKYKRK